MFWPATAPLAGLINSPKESKMGKVNQLFQDQQEADFEAYKLAHPEATEEEVWEAIFQEGPDEPEDIL